MKRQNEIQLNDFQLNVLLSDAEKKGYRYLLDSGIFCARCQGVCEEGIAVQSVHLNSMNNITVEGQCRVCGSPVARVVEFGENPDFYKKAVLFRKTLKPGPGTKSR